MELLNTIEFVDEERAFKSEGLSKESDNERTHRIYRGYEIAKTSYLLWMSKMERGWFDTVPPSYNVDPYCWRVSDGVSRNSKCGPQTGVVTPDEATEPVAPPFAGQHECKLVAAKTGRKVRGSGKRRSLSDETKSLVIRAPDGRSRVPSGPAHRLAECWSCPAADSVRRLDTRVADRQSAATSAVCPARTSHFDRFNGNGRLSPETFLVLTFEMG